MEFKPLIGITYEFVFQIVNTFLVFFLLKKLLFKPVLGIIEAREKDIRENLAQGERAKKEGLTLKSEYEEKLTTVPDEVKDEFEKAITLRVIDTHWMEHINTMAHLREGIHLRSYAQNNPLREYKNEGYELFDELLAKVDAQATTYLLKAEVRQNSERKKVAEGVTNENKDKQKKAAPKRVSKIGRNAPCPCGSGKKYKMCCGK